MKQYAYLGRTVQDLAARATWRPEFVHLPTFFPHKLPVKNKYSF
jgi:hypothetical protein